jgi:acyl-CoA synthetase (AMP-forming)/AMP-acid ligase II/NADP-dependent 3-hydroxy acid dehydrogenase YdfG/acyl carrier protein
MWFLYQSEIGNPFYNVRLKLVWKGRLDVAALTRAWGEVVARHEILRTSFPAVDGAPVQSVAEAGAAGLGWTDLLELPAASRPAELDRLACREAQKPFDLAAGPAVRTTLVRVGEEEHALLLTLHHIIVDGWAVGLLVQELAESYRAAVAGLPSPLASLPMQYSDFARWQRDWLRGELRERQLAYWLSQLGSGPHVLDLPMDRPRPPQQTFSGARRSLGLPAGAEAAARELARRGGASLFMVLLAAFQALLHRYTGERRIGVGSPMAGRNRPDLEPLIGLFTNTLVLRTDLGGGPGFETLLARVREVVLGAFQNQDLPFEQVVEALLPERDPSRPPLFQVAFSLQGETLVRGSGAVSGEGLELPGVALAIETVDSGSVQFDLIFTAVEAAAGLKMVAAYNTDLFDGDRIERLLGHFCVLLAAALAEPRRPVGELPLLTAEERREALAGWRRGEGSAAPVLDPAGAQTPDELWEALAARLCKGVPRPGVRLPAAGLYVLDAAREPAPLGVDGEIYAALSGLPEGLDAGWAGRLGPDPFSGVPGDRMLRTGDRGRRHPDGVELRGGAGRRVWVGEARVDLGRVEAELAADPAVADCAVLVRAGESGPRLIAYVVPHGTVQAGRLPDLLRGRAAASRLTLVEVANLPLRADGRLDETALEALEGPDGETAGRWLESARQVPGVAAAAISVVEESPGSGALHLADLLPSWRRWGAGEAPVTAARAMGPEAGPAGAGAPALAHGGDLHFEEGAPATLPEVLRRAAAEVPGRGVFHVLPDGSEVATTYPGLLAEAERVLGGLRRLGLAAGDKVIFQLDRSTDFLAAFWGCQLGGMVPVPISIPASYAEVNSGVEKLGNAWRMLGRPWVLAGTALAPAVRSLPALLGLPGLAVADIADLRASAPDSEWHPSAPDDLALLFLTSGSTGTPKAVQQHHRAMLSMAAGTAQMNRFSDRDVTLNWMPLDHVGAVVFLHVLPVLLGCRQVHAATGVVLEDPLRWLSWIDRHRATISWAPNFAFALLNERAEPIASQSWDLSTMGFLVNAGESVGARAARRFTSLLAPHGLPLDALRPAFGMSETCSGITWSAGFDLAATADDDPFVELGPPIPGASLRIVDEAGAVVTEGTVGRLEVRGPSVTTGYYENPAANRESFTADGWFRTGDLGFLRQGRLVIAGREKDVIIINGVNFYCHEIEAVAEEVPGVEVSFTAACAVRSPGDEAERLAVFFSPSAGGEDPAGLLERLREALVARAGINPAYLLPVSRESIPKTAIGKIQRSELRRRFEAGELEGVLRSLDLQAENANTLPDWFFRRVWRRREPVSANGAAPQGRALVFADRRGLAPALAGRLGPGAVLVEAGPELRRLAEGLWTLDPGDAEQLRRLFAALLEEGPLPSPVFHLGAYGEWGEGDLAELLLLIQALVTARAGRREDVLLCAVSAAAQPVRPGDRAEPAKAAAVGLVKTAVQEMPWLDARHVDLEGCDLALDAGCLLGEVDARRSEPEVAYRGGERWVPRLERLELCQGPRRPLPLRSGGTYLISGGLGGIGIELAGHLLREMGAHLLLVGRSPHPAERVMLGGSKRRAILAELAAVAAAGGGSVRYASADVGDRAALDAAVAAAEADWGRPLDGVLHLAGVLEERPLEAETVAGLAAALHPKAAGSRALAGLLEARGGGLFVAFSSVNGFFGGSSVGAYAAANAWLDAFVPELASRGVLDVYGLSWSLWDEVGMSRGHAMKDLARARGYRPIGARQGLSSLLAVLHRGPRQALIGLDAGTRAIQRHLAGGAAMERRAILYVVPQGAADVAAEVRRALGPETDRLRLAVRQVERIPEVGGRGEAEADGGSDRSPANDRERALLQIWCEILGLDALDVRTKFFEVGGNSLKVVRMLALVAERLGERLVVADVFKYSTVRALAALIESRRAPQTAVPVPPAGGEVAGFEF